MDAMKAIENRILKRIAFTTLVKVSASKCSGAGYLIDGESVTPGSLEGTGELFKDVPVSPIWAASDGRGIYAAPEAGQLVAVSFIGGNKAFPFVSAVYGETYKPCDSAVQGKLVLCDGKGAKIEFGAKSLLKIMNDVTSLKVILEAVLEIVENLQMTGTGNKGLPVISSPVPEVPIRCAQVKDEMIAKLFEE